MHDFVEGGGRADRQGAQQVPAAAGGAVGDDDAAALGDPGGGRGEVGVGGGAAGMLGVEVQGQQVGSPLVVEVHGGGPARQGVGALSCVAELVGVGVPQPHTAAPGRGHHRRQAPPDDLRRAARVCWRDAEPGGVRGHGLPYENCCGTRWLGPSRGAVG